MAVLVESERVHIVTKRHLAEDESAEEGTGPRRFTVDVGGRSVTLVVAVCMDYLRRSEQILEFQPDVVCVRAFTRKTAPFVPDAPRDYVRVLANAAVHGGEPPWFRWRLWEATLGQGSQSMML